MDRILVRTLLRYMRHGESGGTRTAFHLAPSFRGKVAQRPLESFVALASPFSEPSCSIRIDVAVLGGMVDVDPPGGIVTVCTVEPLVDSKRHDTASRVSLANVSFMLCLLAPSCPVVGGG